MNKYTVEHGNVKIHFKTAKEALTYAKEQSSAKVIQHKTIYEFTKNSTKIQDY